MTTAAELREALALQERIAMRLPYFDEEAFSRIASAARTVALPILEADPELVERIAFELWALDVHSKAGARKSWDNTEHPMRKDKWLRFAETALAALITTDEET